MADGNNLEDRIAHQEPTLDALVTGLVDIAIQISESADKVKKSLKQKFEEASQEIVNRSATALEEEARAQTGKETHGIDVETTDKILNGAMNNSRFDIKVSLAEGIFNGLFCGTTLNLITVHIHQTPAQLPAAPEAPAVVQDVGKTEGV